MMKGFSFQHCQMHSLRRLPATIRRACRSYLERSVSSKPDEAVEAVAPKERNVLVSHSNAVTLIGINRPEKKNCLDVATALELSDALDNFEKDESTKVGLLYGIGGNFCAGYDLTEIAKYDGENEGSVPHFGPLANRLELSSKPLVAALNGYTLGIGLELALMCDLRVMEKTAVLGFLNRRFGIPILCGGTVRLPALIGYSRAMDLILTGRCLSAENALEWGLVNRIAACGSVLGIAANLAQSIVKFPQKTLLADRASAHFATFSGKPVEEALQFEKDNASHLIFEEGVHGANRFITEGVGKHGKSHNISEINNTLKELDKDLL